MDTSARCTCPRGVPHACGEIRPQRRSQQAKRTGILMTDASHRVFEPAPQQYLCPRPLRVYLNSSKVSRTPQNRFGTTCGTTNRQDEFSKFGSETVHKRARHGGSIWKKLRENGMELFAAFAGLAPARGGQAVALAWKGLRPDAGCSMRFRARRGGGLSAAAAAVGTLSCCRPVPASGCRYRAAAGDVVSAACGRGSGRVDVVV